MAEECRASVLHVGSSSNAGLPQPPPQVFLTSTCPLVIPAGLLSLSFWLNACPELKCIQLSSWHSYLDMWGTSQVWHFQRSRPDREIQSDSTPFPDSVISSSFLCRTWALSWSQRLSHLDHLLILDPVMQTPPTKREGVGVLFPVGSSPLHSPFPRRHQQWEKAQIQRQRQGDGILWLCCHYPGHRGNKGQFCCWLHLFPTWNSVLAFNTELQKTKHTGRGQGVR